MMMMIALLAILVLLVAGSSSSNSPLVLPDVQVQWTIRRREFPNKWRPNRITDPARAVVVAATPIPMRTPRNSRRGKPSSMDAKAAKLDPSAATFPTPRPGKSALSRGAEEDGEDFDSLMQSLVDSSDCASNSTAKIMSTSNAGVKTLNSVLQHRQRISTRVGKSSGATIDAASHRRIEDILRDLEAFYDADKKHRQLPADFDARAALETLNVHAGDLADMINESRGDSPNVKDLAADLSQAVNMHVVDLLLSAQ